MLGSPVLEVAIGLCFIYLFLSLIITTLNEGLATVFALRAHNLEAGIRNLLGDDNVRQEVVGAFASFWNNRHRGQRKTLFSDIAGKFEKPLEQAQGTGLATLLYQHGLINPLSKPGSLPSYIPSRTFASALYDILLRDTHSAVHPDLPTFAQIRAAITEKVNHLQLRQALLTMVNDAEADTDQVKSTAEKMKTRIGNWYDDAMDRVSGWYKRNMQSVTLVMSLLLVLIVNGDTVRMVRDLEKNDRLRNMLVASASKVSKSQTGNKDNTIPTLAAVQEEVDNLPAVLNFGYSKDELAHFPTSELPMKIVGLLLTTVAISLGAPFWFDALNRLVCLRGTGSTPAESDAADVAVGKKVS